MGPQFLCVGPEKTGTSWLYKALACHPEIELPPVKEIRYFYECRAYPDEGLCSRFSRHGDWHNQNYRQYLGERVAYYKAHPSSLFRERRRLAWDARFLFGARSFSWYQSLFPSSPSRISGDISPQYVSLPIGDIAHIKEMLPHVKIIILLREPIEWSWSFARMTLMRNGAAAHITDEEYYRFYLEYRDYYPSVLMLDRWTSVFGQNVLIEFYDNLVSDPLLFLNNILAFLGLQKTVAGEFSYALAEKVNQGFELQMPARHAVFLADLYKPIVEELASRFETPRRWLDRYHFQDARIYGTDAYLLASPASKSPAPRQW